MSGIEGRLKGKYAEDRMYALLNERAWKPFWFRSVHKATRKQDELGIDIVVTTDVGDLGIQVKSSNKEMQRFKKRQRNRDATVYPSVACIRFDPEFESELSGKVVLKLREMRDAILAGHTLKRYY